jgi:hypothetical protein
VVGEVQKVVLEVFWLLFWIKYLLSLLFFPTSAAAVVPRDILSFLLLHVVILCGYKRSCPYAYEVPRGALLGSRRQGPRMDATTATPTLPGAPRERKEGKLIAKSF